MKIGIIGQQWVISFSFLLRHRNIFSYHSSFTFIPYLQKLPAEYMVGSAYPTWLYKPEICGRMRITIKSNSYSPKPDSSVISIPSPPQPNISMLYRIPMKIIHVPSEIILITNHVFPKTPLPDCCFTVFPFCIGQPFVTVKQIFSHF